MKKNYAILMWEKLEKSGSEYCLVLLLRSTVFTISTPDQEKTTLDYYAIRAELPGFVPTSTPCLSLPLWIPHNNSYNSGLVKRSLGCTSNSSYVTRAFNSTLSLPVCQSTNLPVCQSVSLQLAVINIKYIIGEHLYFRRRSEKPSESHSHRYHYLAAVMLRRLLQRVYHNHAIGPLLRP